MKFILMDVEGTTTSISFVHDVLFPYSRKHLSSYIKTNAMTAEVKSALNEVQQTVHEENHLEISGEQIVDQLLEWIKIDRKHPALKKLQGLIWKEGYESGVLKGHVYDDVPEALSRWKKAGLRLGIYSSGSVQAQRDLFGYSLKGDLNIYFTHNFDTTIGHKRDPQSYCNILTSLNLKAQDVLFLSDIAEELDAAQSIGMQTIQLIRLEDVGSNNHRQVRSFAEIN